MSTRKPPNRPTREGTLAFEIENDLLARVKKQVEVGQAVTIHDAELRDLILSAVEAVERETSWIIVQATYDLDFDDWPAGDDPLELHVKPVSAINSIKYYDTDGAQQTWASGNYRFDQRRRWPTIWRADFDTSWPSLASNRTGLVTVNFTAGAASVGAIEPNAMQAILAWVARRWYSRGQDDLDAYSPAYRSARNQGRSTAYLR